MDTAIDYASMSRAGLDNGASGLLTSTTLAPTRQTLPRNQAKCGWSVGTCARNAGTRNAPHEDAQLHRRGGDHRRGNRSPSRITPDAGANLDQRGIPQQPANVSQGEALSAYSLREEADIGRKVDRHRKRKHLGKEIPLRFWHVGFFVRCGRVQCATWDSLSNGSAACHRVMASCAFALATESVARRNAAG